MVTDKVDVLVIVTTPTPVHIKVQPSLMTLLHVWLMSMVRYGDDNPGAGIAAGSDCDDGGKFELILEPQSSISLTDWCATWTMSGTVMKT